MIGLKLKLPNLGYSIGLKFLWTLFKWSHGVLGIRSKKGSWFWSY